MLQVPKSDLILTPRMTFWKRAVSFPLGCEGSGAAELLLAAPSSVPRFRCGVTEDLRGDKVSTRCI